MTTSPKYPDVVVELVGKDGNAFYILGAVRQALARSGIAEAEIEKFDAEATSGDYNHLLQTAMEWVTVK